MGAICGRTFRGKQVHPKPIDSDLLSVAPSESTIATISGSLATTASSTKLHIYSTVQSACTLEQCLQLLYSFELLLLVECFECTIPGMYAVYLATLFHLPNSQFFSEFTSLSSEKYFQLTSSIFVYALLELVSLVCVHVVFKCKFNMLAFHQLGFILEQNFAYLQGTFLIWTMIVLDLTLIHNGSTLCPISAVRIPERLRRNKR